MTPQNSPVPVSGARCRTFHRRIMQNLSLLTVTILGGLSLSSIAQTSPSGASTGTDRVSFADSIKELQTTLPQPASASSGTLVRSELTQIESSSTIQFSVALRMRDFPDLQER